MPRKTKSGKHQLNIADELKDILQEFADNMLEAKERGLDKASDYLLDTFKRNSPYDNKDKGKHLKDSWIRTDKYKGVRYIGNSKVNDKNIPLTNLIEFSEKGHPFIRQTFDENKEKIIEIIKGELNNGSK